MLSIKQQSGHGMWSLIVTLGSRTLWLWLLRARTPAPYGYPTGRRWGLSVEREAAGTTRAVFAGRLGFTVETLAR